MKRAWMIIPTYFPVIGGAQVQVQQLSEALSGQSWEVAVITRRHSYAHPRGLPARGAQQGIPVRRLYSRGGGKLGSALFVASGLWFFARRGRGGVYHAHDTGAAGWLAVLAARLLGGRSLIKLRTGRNAYEDSLRSPLVRRGFWALVRTADRVIVVNREVQAWLIDSGLPPERVAWIPNGVDTERYCPPSAGQRAAARARLGLKAGDRAVLYVGRLEHMKGVDVLLRAWAALAPSDRQDARLLVVGDGPERSNLEALAGALETGDSVHFAGEQPAVLPYYHAANLFALPSRTEGLSNALLEAMACALPVVVSNIGGAKDLVQDGHNGLVFESEDAAGLTARLEALLSNPAVWARYGQAARASVMANASLTATIERTAERYRQLTGTAQPTPGEWAVPPRDS